jgi:hypothetical protein
MFPIRTKHFLADWLDASKMHQTIEFTNAVADSLVNLSSMPMFYAVEK